MRPNWTEIPLSSIHESNLEEFAVSGYVVAVIECPRYEQCLVADGIVISPTPIPESSPERPEDLVTLGGDNPTRLGLEVGERYMFYFKRRHGVVGVAKLGTT